MLESGVFSKQPSIPVSAQVVARLQCLLQEETAPLEAIKDVCFEQRMQGSEVRRILFANPESFSDEVLEYVKFSAALELSKQGQSKCEIARECGCTVDQVEQVLLRDRFNKLREIEKEIRAPSIDPKLHRSAEFSRMSLQIKAAEGIDEISVLGSAPKDDGKAKIAPPGTPSYIAALYKQPLLSAQREQFLFKKYCFLKYRAAKLLQGMSNQVLDEANVQHVEYLYANALETRNEIVSKNMRTVVALAKRYAKDEDFYRAISEGNKALMRLVDTFDYTKRSRFSTYSYHGVMKTMQRSWSLEKKHSEMYRTDQNSYLSSRAGEAHPLSKLFADEVASNARRLVDALKPRQKEVIELHYGIDPRGPMNYKEIAQALSMSHSAAKEMGSRAHEKLIALSMESNIPLPFDAQSKKEIKAGSRRISEEFTDLEKEIVGTLNRRRGRTSAEIKLKVQATIEKVEEALCNLVRRKVATIPNRRIRLFILNPEYKAQS